MSDALTAIAPDALFVVACPVCQGQVAAVGTLCGRDACCPLCASLFHVPDPSAPPPEATPAAASPSATAPPPEATTAPSTNAATSPQPEAVPAPVEQTARHQDPTPAPEPSGLAQDWGAVITQLAPLRKDPESAPPSSTGASIFELSGVADPLPVDDQEFTAAADTAEVIGVIDDAVAAQPLREPPRRAGPKPVATANLPITGGTPLDPKAAELAFSEPVRTIRHGDSVIEIRRLTPEERQARRFRRNVLMIVVGVSILLAVVILLGVGGGGRRRRPASSQPIASPIASSSSASRNASG
jgi:hypothetical protein